MVVALGNAGANFARVKQKDAARLKYVMNM
jgi:hypothetical protein